jgi:hypothetical protein
MREKIFSRRSNKEVIGSAQHKRAITPMKRYCLSLMVLALSMPAAHGQAIIMDDFQSYADDTALQAVWTPSTDPLVYRLADNSNNPDAFAEGEKGIEHLGGAVALRDLSNLAPTTTQKVVLKFDIYDTAASANKRVTVGLRQDAGAANLFELGVNNAQSAPHYASRILLPGAQLPAVTGSAQNWIAFNNLVDDAGMPIEPPMAGNNRPVLGWHQMMAEFTDTQATLTLDLNRDGNINATHVVPYTGLADGGWQQIRIGGPSGLTSAGGSMIFDNVMLSLVDLPPPGGLTGDYNDDGTVDAADYVVWRKNLGTNTQLENEGEGITPGMVTTEDYDIWVDNFGNTPPPGLGLSAVVPEPATVAIVAIGVLALFGVGARRR